MNFEKLGWIVAAGLAGGMVGMGFQSPAQKFGNVDIEKVFNESKLYQQNRDSLQASAMARESALRLADQNPSMLTEDIAKYSQAATKEKPSAADKAEIERITKDAAASTAKLRDLQTKATPTPDEVKALNDLTSRRYQNQQLLQKLATQYEQEMRRLQDTTRKAVIDKINEGVREVANKQGFTVVYNIDSAPFASNDITSDVLKTVDAKVK